MSKYSKEELQEMAQRVLQAKEEGDLRYNQFVFILSAITNTAPDKVIDKIESMALGTYQEEGV